MKTFTHEQAQAMLRSGQTASSEDQEGLTGHLSGCSECQAYAALVSELNLVVPRMYPVTPLSTQEIHRKIGASQLRLRRQSILTLILHRTRTVIWLGASLALVLALILLSPRLLPTQMGGNPTITPLAGVSDSRTPVLNVTPKPGESIRYTVSEGESIISIADKFGLKASTILWVNPDQLADDPHKIKPGMVLRIPSVDGLYYRWKLEDKIEAIASQYGVASKDILNWPENVAQIGSANKPNIQPGVLLFIPGGKMPFQTVTTIPGANTPAPTIEPVQTQVSQASTFVTSVDGAELVVRAGPGTRFDPVGRLKGGEKAPALGKTSLGEWIKISLPGTPDGTGWVNAGIVMISGAELAVVADASVNPPVARTGTNLLGMQSSPEEIRNLILHPIWNVVWVDGQAVNYNPLNGRTIRFFVQAWLEKTGGGRVISSNQLENVTTRTPDLLPKWVWLHDGKALQGYDTETKTFDPSMARMRWSVHPLEMAGELMQILFPYFLENMGDQPIQTVHEETFAGQPALIVDWGPSRFWVDETSGVLLRQQGFSTSDHSGQPQGDLFLSQIRYASQLPGDLFDPNQLDQLRFLETAPVPQGQSEALDAIGKFSHQEVTSFTVKIGTIDPNVPGTKVDQYTVNDATYYVDPQTYRIVEFSGPLYATEESQIYSPETLEQMAVQLVQEQLPKINLQDYQLQRSNKSVNNFFFRWSLGAAGEPGYLTFIQVSYTLHGKLIGYINALPIDPSVLPSKTSTPLPGSPGPAATGKPTGKVYFSLVSGSDPWTKITWLSLDCLAGQNACQPAIQTLPVSVQKNMAGKLAWSPDGKQFALESNPDGSTAFDILVADASGEHLLNLTHSPERETDPAWSPDGAYLLYVNNFTVENVTRSEIWVSRPDGTDQRKVADGNIAAWSLDGRQILYAAAEGPAGKPIIAIANRSGGDPIWGKTVQNSVRDLAWSPDGSKFVISSVDGIFSMDRDGSHATQLAPDLVGISNTAWSADGQHLAFFAHASRQAPPNLYTIQADGSGLVNLTNSNLGGQFGFSWSPDGNWLVYDSTKDSGHGNIFISNADGSQQYQLTQSSGSPEYLMPSWQPGP